MADPGYPPVFVALCVGFPKRIPLVEADDMLERPTSRI